MHRQENQCHVRIKRNLKLMRLDSDSTKEYLALETRYASAVIDEAAEQDATATDDLDAQGKETRGLEERVAVPNYLISST